MSATEPTWSDLDRWVHLVSHLRAEKGRGPYPPSLFLFDCWFPEPVPDWAGELVDRNAPGWQWCPRLSPSLLTTAPV